MTLKSDQPRPVRFYPGETVVEIELLAFSDRENPHWTLTDDAVTRNNCYCFASNHLANVRGARPGRRGGRLATSMSCAACVDGLRADGWIDGCQVDTLTIAMVIWPREDYHFYRGVTAGTDWWWGHKPGGTPARYTDESNRPIKQPLSPINCARGPTATSADISTRTTQQRTSPETWRVDTGGDMATTDRNSDGTDWEDDDVGSPSTPSSCADVRRPSKARIRKWRSMRKEKS